MSPNMNMGVNEARCYQWLFGIDYMVDGFWVSFSYMDDRIATIADHTIMNDSVFFSIKSDYPPAPDLCGFFGHLVHFYLHQIYKTFWLFETYLIS